MDNTQATLKGKILITGKLKVETGLHIGAGSDFAPIGSVDSPFIRDTLTQTPIIPGSSIKGKMRTLLVKSRTDGYILNSIDKDDAVIQRLFGAGGDVIKPARLQFYDLFITEDSLTVFFFFDTDTYLGEVKAENVINRLSGEANPRQIERVPAGMEFVFKLVYNIENEDEVVEDLQTVKEGLELLEMDYIGGHGSRGYGRVSLNSFATKIVGKAIIDEASVRATFEG